MRSSITFCDNLSEAKVSMKKYTSVLQRKI